MPENMIGLIAERLEEVIKLPEVQQKMIKIKNEKGEDSAIKYAYMLAIATLYGAA